MAHAFVDTAELLQLGDGNISDIDVTELLEDAPFLAMLYAQEASNETSHEWLKKITAPATGFRAVNDGRENTKAVYSKVTQNLKLFDAGVTIDMGLMKTRSGDRLKRREAIDHLKAAFADMEKQIIYGTGEDSTGFNGLSDETTVDDSDDAMVINAAGTTVGGSTSVWAVRSGEDAVSVVYGQGATIELGEEYPTTMPGSTTGTYDAMRTPILFWGGVQVATSLDLGRIVNLTEESGKTLNDDMLSDLISLFPAGRKPTHLVMNRQSQKQLQQSRTATNATGVPAPFPSEAFNIPILTTDQISNTEALKTVAA